ncbi:LacI family DNA-binding transcriptional regulator [Tengunoibacter tsumagoiensis]|uniref:LacI family transcriptional regulator n=1 Tax=Tengunoibacter tsumagoiensis TaxID=2014871 RepID=A0A402A133_9CHLR|nr:LacI family DNA-binding transcriptional regulator [Tengunoibacter tsumagoiensis]GCE12762.1 LacI family transcriptional regulator [Tengunoibacter tsumagoiensis]
MSNQRETNEVPRTVISDIAERSGVSATTVSRVLNGHKDVSAATRNKVMQYIKELGYVSHRTSRTSSAQLGITVPMFNNYFGKIIEGVYEALQGRNAQLLPIRTNNYYDAEVSQVQQLMNQEISGMIFTLPQENADELLRIKQKGLPFVVADPFRLLPDEIPTIMVENISASMIATEHLLKLGHRRIGVITGPPDWKTTIDRTTGYYAALASAGIPIDPVLICEGRWQADSGDEAARQLLALPEPPTAIFAFNDDMAIGAIYAVHASGLRVPEDISVVGCDDALDDLPYALPPLTTIHQPLREIGRIAVDVLYRIMQQQPLEATHIKLSARLIVRHSTGPRKQ